MITLPVITVSSSRWRTNELFYLQDEPRNFLTLVPPVSPFERPFDQQEVEDDRQGGDEDAGQVLANVHSGHFSFKKTNKGGISKLDKKNIYFLFP